MFAFAHAVELGDALVRSHIGQPLSADIELTGIVNDAATVQAGLADAEVYRGANVAIHPAVAALNITIIRREGKRFLHLTSPKPVDAEFVHIFFELNENGRRAVRQTTLWLTPDTHPAPPKPAQAPAPVAPAPAATVAPAPPAKPPLAAQVAPPAAIAPVRLMPALAAPTARPAACIPQFTAAQIGTCAALDAKNAALSAQIVELEDKVKRLTVAMQAGAVTVAPAPPARVLPKTPPEQLAPMGAPARSPARSSAHPAAGATPWLFIGLASALVFALVGVLVYVLRRKRKAATPKPAAPVGAGFMAGVRDRILPGRKPAETPPPVEPAAG